MPFKSCFGKIEGGVLSPQLFTEFLSDLGDYLGPECGVKLDRKLLLYLLFADDLILFSHSVRSLPLSCRRSNTRRLPNARLLFVHRLRR